MDEENLKLKPCPCCAGKMTGVYCSYGHALKCKECGLLMTFTDEKPYYDEDEREQKLNMRAYDAGTIDACVSLCSLYKDAIIAANDTDSRNAEWVSSIISKLSESIADLKIK